MVEIAYTREGAVTQITFRDRPEEKEEVEPAEPTHKCPAKLTYKVVPSFLYLKKGLPYPPSTYVDSLAMSFRLLADRKHANRYVATQPVSKSLWARFMPNDTIHAFMAYDETAFDDITLDEAAALADTLARYSEAEGLDFDFYIAQAGELVDADICGKADFEDYDASSAAIAPGRGLYLTAYDRRGAGKEKVPMFHTLFILRTDCDRCNRHENYYMFMSLHPTEAEAIAAGEQQVKRYNVKHK